jgi:hypothetical protein
MSSSDAQAERDELQFDRVETSGAQAEAGTETPAVLCEACGKPVGSQYYHINGKTACDNCRQLVLSSTVTPRTTGPLVRAGLFGLAAAVAGAAIYYAVIAITNFEIGLVAILIGYMVGYMVRKGAGGRGGRRFQVLAVVLTYWAVGLAYTPLAFKGGSDDDKVTAASDSTASGSAASTPAALDTSNAVSGELRDEGSGGGSALKAFGMLAALVFALPVMYVAQSMPGGILSALIILIGLRQAWSMTASPKLEISGPYKVGAVTAVPASE